jgi:glycosyltransferase involved in cell wall biosynthesis
VPSSLHVDSYRGWSGGQAQSLGLALALAARGEETFFVAQRGSQLESHLKRTYLSWEARELRGLSGLRSVPRLAARFRELHTDIIHIHESASHVAVGVAARLAHKPKIIVTRRTERAVRKGWAGVGKYRLWCDRLICISEALKRRYIEAGLPERMLVVIPDFVDCRHFVPTSPPPADAAGPPTIIVVGQLSADKGHRVLIRAMADVVRRVPEAHLRIVGEGEEGPSLRKHVQTLGLDAHVEFTGFLPDVREAVAQADLFVQPSLWEGLGLAVLEAMAMARPVVVSDAGGLPESVVHDETGLIVPAGDANALVEALVDLLTDRQKANQMGLAGRQRALAHYDRPRIVERIIALYEEVLGELP